MVRLAELIVILELHQQGMTVSAIARRTGLHRSTIAKYLARGIEPPVYGPRPPRPTKLEPFERYLRERIAAVPELTGSRLHREIRGLGFAGGYTVLKGFLRQVRPRPAAGFEDRFETPAGRQAQVDCAHFRTDSSDEPGAERIVWLFSLVLGHTRRTGVAGERNAGIAAPLGRSGKVVEPSFDPWTCENVSHFASHRRQYVFTKPWIFVFPEAASPRRMR